MEHRTDGRHDPCVPGPHRCCCRLRGGHGMRLDDIAYARSGDKGDTANICVFPFKDEDYVVLCERLTADVVARRFAGLCEGTVNRYELPGTCGLNFVLTKALDGGVSTSLRVDVHGKS